MRPPLDGIAVLDLTRVLSGPYGTTPLADKRAPMIKIERPSTGDDTRAWGPPFLERECAYFLRINRNTVGVTLDVKKPEGWPILDRIIATSDVLGKTFRPGTLGKLDLDYGTLGPKRPRRVYASISDLSRTGPRRNELEYDAGMQAEGGSMSLAGAADGPPACISIAIADIVSVILAAHGVTLALFARAHTGRGQAVNISMLDAVVALLTHQAGIYFATGSEPPRLGNRHPTIVPYETFDAYDGEFLLALGNDDQWRRFRAVAGLDHDERLSTNGSRVTRYDELKPIFVGRLWRGTREYWIECLTAADVPCGSVRNLQEVVSDPQPSAPEVIADVQHAAIGVVRLLGAPAKLSEMPAPVCRALPHLDRTPTPC